MTRQTSCVQTKIGELFCLDFLIFDKFGLVAVGTLFFSMGILECKSGNPVVEFFLCKTDDLEIYPMMVTVTGKAFLVFYLCRGMISLFLLNPYFQFCMAVEAFLVGYLLSQDMTFGAV